MKFDWRNFTEADYDRLFKEQDYIGNVYVGDICIEVLVDRGTVISNDNHKCVEVVMCNFYVANEDTGYGYKDNGTPYDYADGFDIDMPHELSYDEFKEYVEKKSVEYIKAYRRYSLVEHANRPLEIW